MFLSDNSFYVTCSECLYMRDACIRTVLAVDKCLSVCLSITIRNVETSWLIVQFLHHLIAQRSSFLKPVASGEINWNKTKLSTVGCFVSADRRQFCFISVSEMCGRVKADHRQHCLAAVLFQTSAHPWNKTLKQFRRVEKYANEPKTAERMKIDQYCQRQRCKHVELQQFLARFRVVRGCQRQLGFVVFHHVRRALD